MRPYPTLSAALDMQWSNKSVMIGPCLRLPILLHVMGLLAVLSVITRHDAILLLHLHVLLLHLPGHTLHPCTAFAIVRSWDILSVLYSSVKRGQHEQMLRGASYLLACHSGPSAVA